MGSRSKPIGIKVNGFEIILPPTRKHYIENNKKKCIQYCGEKTHKITKAEELIDRQLKKSDLKVGYKYHSEWYSPLLSDIVIDCDETHLAAVEKYLLEDKTVKAKKPIDKKGIFRWKDQSIYNINSTQIKRTEIHTKRNFVSSKQEFTKDGIYRVNRYANGKRVSGYELKPFEQKFATGNKGKLQRFGMRIATDRRGREIPILRNLGEWIFNLAQKVK